jgi:DNA-directed RNA polymerase subunit alpha
MDKIILPKSYEEKSGDNVSKFTIEPLHPGYGATFGNALRRVLLSSLPGAAVTSFKLEGVSHEFASVPHVKEDVVEIMLNIKSLKIKTETKEPVKLALTKKGPGVVTAGDFSLNPDVEIINKDLVLATLDNNASFNLEITIECDRGFRATEAMEAEKNEPGLILVDATFSPIERVKVETENTRVGQMTNYDKLTIEITTNGGISPRDAIVAASNILIDHYKSFSFDEAPIESLTAMPEEVDETMGIDDNESIDETVIRDEGGIKPKTKVEDAGFSQRTTNSLLNAGVKSLAGVQRLSDLKLSEIKGLGKKGLEEIKEMVAKL